VVVDGGDIHRDGLPDDAAAAVGDEHREAVGVADLGVREILDATAAVPDAAHQREMIRVEFVAERIAVGIIGL
jgi:nicotinate-nucleotide pyrophosphorylase